MQDALIKEKINQDQRKRPAEPTQSAYNRK